jgi:hypothetical protein
MPPKGYSNPLGGVSPAPSGTLFSWSTPGVFCSSHLLFGWNAGNWASISSYSSNHVDEKSDSYFNVRYLGSREVLDEIYSYTPMGLILTLGDRMSRRNG